MELRILVQETPNPKAKKFLLTKPVKREGKITYHKQEECYNNILAHDLLGIAHVTAVHFFENVITITQDGAANWDDLEWLAKAIIETRFPIHDPDFKEAPDKKEKPKISDPELLKIEEVLDRTIRSGLQMDGGDLELVAVDGNLLKVRYLGACGTCPSSTMGTLEAIKMILRNEYNPELEVVIA
ncbi:MAG: NifU family protein [Bdellovibrionales bacterium]|nr:NifU family protein [Bdellovibrionales bacterium]